MNNHIDEVKKQTGKDPQELSVLAKAQNLATHNEIVDWLKTKFELSHGHATTITRIILETEPEQAHDMKVLADRFSGGEADWIPAIHELLLKIYRFGSDVGIILRADPIELKRASVVFGAIAVSAGKMEISVQLPEPHTVTIIVQQQITDGLISSLRLAYDNSL